jgi:hypothetical protein
MPTSIGPGLARRLIILRAHTDLLLGPSPWDPAPKRCLLAELTSDQNLDLTRLDVPVRVQFRIDQVSVHGNLETPAIRRDQRQRFNLGLKFSQQFGRQTGGPVQVMSNGAIFNLNG